jgi:metallo-beta-lactamase class B
LSDNNDTEEEIAMRIRPLTIAALGLLGLCGAAAAQSSQSEIDAHVAAAKAAAGLDYRGTFLALCLPGGFPPGAGRGAAPGGRGAAPGGRAAAPAPRPVPDRATWYASPYKVFDNLYWLGTRQHSSWALRTSAGIIIIDTNFDYAIEPEIVEGLTKLGLNPRDVKYVILSHAHGDHDEGVALLQSRYGAHVIMGGPDWDATLKRDSSYAGGVPKRGPGDVSVGPEGYKLTLGDNTVNIVFTPGHTVGTISDIFPVRDNGKTVMVAYSGGTLTGAFGSDAVRWDEYIASQKRIADAAKAAGASVIISNHSEYDDAYTKSRLVAAKREVGEENPFIVGADGVQKYFTVMEECATASKLRNNAR